MPSESENSILLARIEERLKNLTEHVASLEVEVKDFRIHFNTEMTAMEKKVREEYISKDTFLPVQRAMFAAITTIVGAVVMAVLNFAFKGH